MPRIPLTYTINTPPNDTSIIGFNIPWLHYDTGAETNHDGYGNGFDDTYFNGTGANANIQAQLDLLKANNVKYIRLWLCMTDYMNADRETVGYKSFRTGFLTNLATYCDWCAARGIKMLICLDDCWYTFPWWWIGSAKQASYIQACVDVVTELRSKSAVWGWDYCNEPYMGWWGSGKAVIKHTHYQDGVYGGHDIYTRDVLTSFFKLLYTTLKAIVPTHLFTVGDSKPDDNNTWDIKSACDFYCIHWYGINVSDFTFKASQYDKMCIVGEYGYGKSGQYLTHHDFMTEISRRMLMNGFSMLMPWALDGVLVKTGTNAYSTNSIFKILNSF